MGRACGGSLEQTRCEVQGRTVMLENTDFRSSPMSSPSRSGDGTAHGGAAKLVRELGDAGVEARVLRTAGGIAAGGAPLSANVGECLAPGNGGELLCEVVALVRARMPVTLCLRHLGGGDAAIDALEAFCTLLRDRLEAESLPPTRVGISIPSHVVPLQAYLLLTSGLLGRGPRYVILDGLQMRHHADPRAQRTADHNWSFLWQRRAGSPSLVPAYAASVTTRCPLLGDEAATAVLPELGLQAPVGSAWLPLVVRLTEFSDGRGRLCWERLQHALTAAIDLGEALLDRCAWPAPSLARDAADNRRLAVELRGIGDLAVERGANPADLASLRWIDRVVARVHALLWGRSQALARARGPLPSLLRSEPTIGWRCDRSRSDWQLRWRRAVAESGMRHRNLLVLSPYSVLPAGAESASDYLDLLPVLHHADAFAFGRPPAGCFRHTAEFARFHRRAWAVMQRRNAASFVATGV